MAEIENVRRRVANGNIIGGGLGGVLAVVDSFTPAAAAAAACAPRDEWRSVLVPYWGSELMRYSTAASAEDLADWLARTGVSPAAAAAMQFPVFAATAGATLAISDAAVAHSAARLAAATPGVSSAAVRASGDDDCVNVATAPPPGHRGTMATRIAAVGAYEVATSERNVHGAFGAAGGAALLMLWKALQDETTAAAAAGVSRGTGQDVYFGVLAATVPLMAAAVAFSMTLLIATQVARGTDVTAARYLSVPTAARYADVITFVAGAISAAVSQSFLLWDTPQGDWVTFVFAGTAAAAVAVLAVACTAFTLLMRRPFSAPSLHASLARPLEVQFERLLSAAGAHRRAVANAAFADKMRVRAMKLCCDTAACGAHGGSGVAAAAARPLLQPPRAFVVRSGGCAGGGVSAATTWVP
jgi:hypothetical protein